MIQLQDFSMSILCSLSVSGSLSPSVSLSVSFLSHSLALCSLSLSHIGSPALSITASVFRLSPLPCCHAVRCSIETHTPEGAEGILWPTAAKEMRPHKELNPGSNHGCKRGNRPFPSQPDKKLRDRVSRFLTHRNCQIILFQVTTL